MSCSFTTEDCSPKPVAITNTSGLIVTQSNNLDETIVIDTFQSAPQYIKVLLVTDSQDICNPILDNPIDINTIEVTFDKDILVNYNTLVPAYTNFYTTEFNPIAIPFYDTRDYSKVFIPLNQSILSNTSFTSESIVIAYHFTTEDGIQLSDSTSILLDY